MAKKKQIGFDGDRLRRMRETEKLTREAFGKILTKANETFYGKSSRIVPSQIALWESTGEDGERSVNPSSDNLALFAHELGVSADFLLGLSAVPRPRRYDDLSPEEQRLIERLRRQGGIEALEALLDAIG
jgi:transcriptional regulator with XRE-family HTH domain